MQEQKESDRSLIDLIIDCIKKIDVSYDSLSDRDKLIKIYKLCDFLLDRYTSKILYTLNELEFASKQELHKKLNLNWQWMEKNLDDMESCMIINELVGSVENKNILNEYWKIEFPNSHQKLPVFFVVNEHFKPIVNQFSKHITTKYFKQSELRIIQRRKETYQRHKSIVINQFKRQSEPSIGNCKICGSFIKESYKKGRHYHVFTGNMICDICYSSADKSTIKQWMQKTK